MSNPQQASLEDKQFLANLNKTEKKILLSLIAHPGWMSLAFLKSSSQVLEEEVLSVLQDLETRKYILKSDQAPYYWQCSSPELSERLRAYFSSEDFVLIHQKLFQYIRSLPDATFYRDMLLFHAVRGELNIPAFRYSFLLAEALMQDDAMEEALNLFQQTLAFADTPFKQAYLQNEIAGILFQLGRYTEAGELWLQALQKSETIPWPPQALTCALSLANLYSHQGRFHEAENYYRQSLSCFSSFQEDSLRRQILQNLASGLIEQGRYSEALEIFDTLSAEANSSIFEKVAIGMHRVRIYNALGATPQAWEELQSLQQQIVASELSDLKPYLDFLKGRFELAQAHFVESFRHFEEAAQGFEAAQDLAGKVDVLLALSSVLLENFLLQEAHQLVDEISAWKGLSRYPALEQAIRLRRLTLGAFSGRWVQQDIALLKPEAEKTGRQEDWLQFWFHLSLAALRIGNVKLAENFLARSKNILDRVSSFLSKEQLKSFRHRPDIARMFRLIEKDTRPLSETQAVRADQAALDFDEAPEASLAPPISNRPR